MHHITPLQTSAKCSVFPKMLWKTDSDVINISASSVEVLTLTLYHLYRSATHIYITNTLNKKKNIYIVQFHCYDFLIIFYLLIAAFCLVVVQLLSLPFSWRIIRASNTCSAYSYYLEPILSSELRSISFKSSGHSNRIGFHQQDNDSFSLYSVRLLSTMQDS